MRFEEIHDRFRRSRLSAAEAADTQVGRALAQLGIRHIAAYSPEARGRGERLFGTLQNRLPRELANRYLAETYIPAHNRRFRVAAERDGSAFVPWTGSDLVEILRHHYVKATVQVRRYRDDSLALFHGPRRIGRYNRDGSLRDHQLAA